MAAWSVHAWAATATGGPLLERPLPQPPLQKQLCHNARVHATPPARSLRTIVHPIKSAQNRALGGGRTRGPPRSVTRARCEAEELGGDSQGSEDVTAAARSECETEGQEAPQALLRRPRTDTERHHPRDSLLQDRPPVPVPRRAALLSALLAAPLLSLHLSLPAPAPAESSSFFQRGLSKYIKKKRLDPLDTYVPTVLITAQQLQSVKSVIEDPASDAEAIVNARYLLRTGAAASLRTDLRAIAQYAEEAEEAGEGATLPTGLKPRDAAEDCLRVLIDLDLLMRTEPDSARGRMLTSLNEAQGILSQLLGTVPEDVLQRSQAVVQAVSAAPSLADPGTEGSVEGRAGKGTSEGASEEQGVPEASGTGSGFQSKLLQRKKSEAELLEKLL